ncbi:MAG: NAD(P)H-dependent oxidoreductase [Alphaproteobacteria bacterium]|nr:NAD(P)H-dependent oxidoreductase [Alphaproteobacteria bacterium]
MTLLYINACVRPQSRTKILADYVVAQLSPQSISFLDLDKCNLKYADNAFLQKRGTLIATHQFDHPMFAYAREFASADNIVIAAPYWDFSFPALLKMYIENVNVVNIVFKYSSTGEIVPLCRAENLYYVTTKGGYNSDDYGFKYIEALCKRLYGIKNVFLIEAEGLDIQGNNANEILQQACKKADEIIK